MRSKHPSTHPGESSHVHNHDDSDGHIHDDADGHLCDHSGAHSHSHHHGSMGHSHFSHANTSQKLAFSVGLTLVILAAELIGGVLSGSLALLSDAAHMVTDVAALGLAWYAGLQSCRPPTGSRTYGYHRSGIMAALVNAVSLIAVAGFIAWEAWNRLLHPPRHIVAPIMFGVAAVALLVNLGIARLLGHGHGENLNVRSALLHVLGDAAASAGVIIGGVIIAIKPGWGAVDPVLSVVIAFIIVWGAWQILQETVNVLMEGAPTGVDTEELQNSLMDIAGVREVHHVHIWSLCPGMNALSGHVVIEDLSVSQTEGILSQILELLRSRYNIDHVTIQFEHRQCGLVCTLQQDRGLP